MTVSQELSFKMYDFDNKFWKGAVTTYETIRNAGKLEELEDYMDCVFPDGASLGEINDFLWFEGETVLRDLGLLEEGNDDWMNEWDEADVDEEET